MTEDELKKLNPGDILFYQGGLRKNRYVVYTSYDHYNGALRVWGHFGYDLERLIERHEKRASPAWNGTKVHKMKLFRKASGESGEANTECVCPMLSGGGISHSKSCSYILQKYGRKKKENPSTVKPPIMPW